MQSEGKPKVLGRGCGGEPFFRRVSPTKAHGISKFMVKRKLSDSKIKSAIQKKAHKKAETYKSASQYENKQIADFICTKERSDFRATIARMREISSRRGKFTDEQFTNRGAKRRGQWHEQVRAAALHESFVQQMLI